MATLHSPIFRLQRFLQAEEFRNLPLTPIGMREIRKFTCETVHRSVDKFFFNVRAFFFLGPSPQFSDKCVYFNIPEDSENSGINPMCKGRL